jgi:hypothetical protein
VDSKQCAIKATLAPPFDSRRRATGFARRRIMTGAALCNKRNEPPMQDWDDALGFCAGCCALR